MVVKHNRFDWQHLRLIEQVQTYKKAHINVGFFIAIKLSLYIILYSDW